VLDLLDEYSMAMHAGWPHADATEQQAAQLHVFGNRLGQLCAAASLISVPPEILGQAVGLGESLRISHAWTMLALEELNCCGSAQTEYFDIGYNSTSFESVRAAAALELALKEYSGSSGGSSERVVEIERFGLQLTIDDAAIIVRNSVDVAVVFAESQEILYPSSLGPEPWRFGTGIRIKRLRNSSELSVEQAVVEYEGLLTRFGDVERASEIVLKVVDEIQFETAVLEHGWVGSTIVFVRDGFTYFVESMCRPEFADQCESVERSIKSIGVTS
jgi:hypothetical protein